MPGGNPAKSAVFQVRHRGAQPSVPDVGDEQLGHRAEGLERDRLVPLLLERALTQASVDHSPDGHPGPLQSCFQPSDS